MEIKVKGIKSNVGYALWALNRLTGETEQEFLDRAVSIDNALRKCDGARNLSGSI